MMMLVPTGVTAAVFGLMHGDLHGGVGIVRLVSATLLGLGAGALRHWTGTLVKGAHVYGVEAYQAAFVLIVGWSLFSCVMIMLTHETNCQQTV